MMWRALFVLAIGAVAAAAQPLAKAIDAQLATPEARRAIWSIHVRDLASKQTVYAHNVLIPFTPASNMKLFTTALALTRLGPDHRFVTRVLAGSGPDAEGVVKGPLVLVGGGDPSLSGRTYPYFKDAKPLPALGPLEALADEVVAAGVRGVSGGGVVGDDTLYPFEAHAEGWTVDDTVWDYGTAASALVVNENSFVLSVRPPRRAGEPVTVSIFPPWEGVTVHNTVNTGVGLPNALQVERAAGSMVIRLSGTLPVGGSPVTQRLAFDDPALAAAQLFQQLLEERGVRFRGPARAQHRFSGGVYAAPEGVEVARRLSPPLSQVLQVVNKVSQNLHAEIVLRETARVSRGDGTRKAALEEMTAFLRTMGIPNDHHDLFDGSGLSRKTLVTGSATTRLLEWMAGTEHAGVFLETLPVGGEDGSLSYRFRKVPGADRVRAKTGTLAHVTGLSGYIMNGERPRWAFSIYLNHANMNSFAGRELVDKIVEEILRTTGP
jgi:serine-type D-Ala-D-Ala carboxypeptidase/endopeptidase (penicillin-binding protein 4)